MRGDGLFGGLMGGVPRVCVCVVLVLGCSSQSPSSTGDPDASMVGMGDGAVGSGGGTSAAGGGSMGTGGTDSTGGMVASGGTAATTGGEGSTTGGIVGVVPGDWEVPDELKLCGGEACQCANGLDDDGDGVADGFDSECTGPNDDDESTFATGISGDNSDPFWQDCFFDGNSGAGDDKCRYHTDCLTGDKQADDADCQVNDTCIEFCGRRTPSGCDCFGCCDFRQDDGTTLSVVINEDCTEEDLGACTQCDKSTQCENTCEACELCPGKTIADLPVSCFEQSTGGSQSTGGTQSTGGSTATGGVTGTGGEGGVAPPFTCDFDRTPCFSTGDCMTGQFCSLGCCISGLE